MTGDTITITVGTMIGGVITIGIFLLSHLGLAVWFAARLSTQVAAITKTLEDVAAEVKTMNAFDKRIAILEDRQSRSELDIREALKAAALVALAQKDGPHK